MWKIIGQSRATTLLERSIKAGQLSHAYLFVGPPHVGKFTLALGLAQAVNCQASDVPCGECTSCRRIAGGKHSDIYVIGVLSGEGKKEISIDQVKEMQSAASLPPYEGRHKVFIFDKAELLSQEAANRLLKTLEEPSPRVLIILLTSRESEVLPTVVSRCQRVELRPLPITLIKETLAERYSIDNQKAELLARVSGGCLGWALLALQEEALLKTRDQRLANMARLREATIMQRFAYAAELANQFSKRREEIKETLDLWIRWWHDLLLIRGDNSESITNVDHQAALFQQARDLNGRQISGFIRHLQEASQALEQNANPRLVFDNLMLTMP
ncbi:MAG: DNA polymerase III subunit delta' [Chloroflexi bacterium]|nr:DNA polymerase III subunit delta' [Chloroflexota bacterium]